MRRFPCFSSKDCFSFSCFSRLASSPPPSRLRPFVVVVDASRFRCTPAPLDHPVSENRGRALDEWRLTGGGGWSASTPTLVSKLPPLPATRQQQRRVSFSFLLSLSLPSSLFLFFELISSSQCPSSSAPTPCLPLLPPPPLRRRRRRRGRRRRSLTCSTPPCQYVLFFPFLPPFARRR